MKTILAHALFFALCVSCKEPATTPAPNANATTASTPKPITETPPMKKDTTPLPKSIGDATMEPDGTIVLQLRAEGPGGLIGDGLIKYPPKHAQYESVKKHLGGLKPGEHKPVPPFP